MESLGLAFKRNMLRMFLARLHQKQTAREDPAAQDLDHKTSRIASGFERSCMGLVLRLPVRVLVLSESGVLQPFSGYCRVLARALEG